jgi:hypothetical protein
VTTKKNLTRLPRSLRKYLRTQKAELRRTLAPAEAQRAIDQLVRSLRRSTGTQSA